MPSHEYCIRASYVCLANTNCRGPYGRLSRKNRRCAQTISHPPWQAYEDTLEWPEPLAGSRAILSLGDHTIVAQLPAPAMLPAPAPPEELTSHAALQRLPSGGEGRQPILEGAFHEVLFAIVSNLCQTSSCSTIAACYTRNTYLFPFQ